MRYYLALLFILFGIANAAGQDQGGIAEGKVSFVTTQSVYVRFSSFEWISEGDTLFVIQGSRYVPALLISNKSSVSCVCSPLLAKEFKVGDAVYANMEPVIIPDISREEVIADTVEPAADKTEIDSSSVVLQDQDKRKQKISGRVSVSSYSDLFSRDATRRQRMRYTFSMRAKNLGGTGFSAESYLSFSHTNTNWEDIKSNIFNGLKIYNLSIKYDFDETIQISAGRKINPSLSSAGAIDGLQFSKNFGSLTLGAIAGSRPDYKDYSFNTDLMQFGVYAGHNFILDRVRMQNSLAFIEQTNRFVTDRRFIYIQHSSWLMKNLALFGSAEMDLYKNVNDIKETTFTFSNVYLSMRYRIIRKLSVGLSYTSRQNIIYYETYKDFVERLLEKEALQGWRIRINSRPVKNLIVGVSGGYRYRKEDPQPSKHVYCYATYRSVPGIRAAMTLSATWLETSYLTGNIYSLGLTKEIIPGKLSGGMKYRYVDYLYQSSEIDLVQNIIETDLNWIIAKKLSLSIYYEGSFETSVSNNRFYINLTKRF